MSKSRPFHGTMPEELHAQATAKSKEIFGKPNLSGYLSMLAIRDLKDGINMRNKEESK